MTCCALVGASDFNEEQFKVLDALGSFDTVIAVDAGFASLEAIGRVPDLALGDFDSLGYIPRGLRVARFPADKDKSDMELAFDRVMRDRHEKVIVFGALGRRLDHTLANIQIFSRFSERGLYVTAIDFAWAVSFVTGPDLLTLPAFPVGSCISVFAMNDEAKGVFEHGLKYELDDVLLTNRTSRGLSNESLGEAAAIGVDKGTLAVVHPL